MKMKRYLFAILFALTLPCLSDATSMDVDLQDCYISSLAPTTNFNTTELIIQLKCNNADCETPVSQDRVLFGCKGFKDSLINAGGYSGIVLDSLLLRIKIKRGYCAS